MRLLVAKGCSELAGGFLKVLGGMVVVVLALRCYSFVVVVYVFPLYCLYFESEKYPKIQDTKEKARN